MLRSETARPGFSLGEVVAVLAATTVISSFVFAGLATVRDADAVDASLDNLRTLGVGHGIYAAEWNGRQVTTVPDPWSDLGSSPTEASFFWLKTSGLRPTGITLGWGFLNVPGGTITEFRFRTSNIANVRLIEPIVFDGVNANVVRGVGAWRFPNTRQFRTYVAGQFHDDVFYAPDDEFPNAMREAMAGDPLEYSESDAYGLPGQIAGFGPSIAFSSYCLAPAAMFDPSVFAARRLVDGVPTGGWRDPWNTPGAFRSPGLWDARYPDLKTHMLEHHWLQNGPATPNFDLPRPLFACDAFGVSFCEPYAFNQGIDAAPATLFYDGHVRLLPTVEAIASDRALRRASPNVDGTWSRTTPWGADGYNGRSAFDGTRVNHHVLTADGILGRDTLGPGRADEDAARRDAARAWGTRGARAADAPASSRASWSTDGPAEGRLDPVGSDAD